MAAGMAAVRRIVTLALAVAMVAPAASVLAQSSNEMYFDLVWARTDGPIATGNANRSWVWGPTKYGEARMEAYVESPNGMRLVQYFDKSRMEITQPGANPNSEWYVTNGLLVTELITGQMQVGDGEFEDRQPAQINVAGDSDDPNGPTYATFLDLVDEPATPAGWIITSRVDRAGNVTTDESLAEYNVTVAEIDSVTGHAVAQPFRDFANSTGVIWANSAYVTGLLFQNPLFALGRPITEPYWAEVKLAGTERDVLLQCFERRCVTFTPGNPDGWLVEAGNVGRHYFSWRYSVVDPGDPGNGEAQYLQTVVESGAELRDSLERFDELIHAINVVDPEWLESFDAEMDLWRALETEVSSLVPPISHVSGHGILVAGYQFLTDAADLFDNGVHELGLASFNLGSTRLGLAIDLITAAQTAIAGPANAPNLPNTNAMLPATSPSGGNVPDDLSCVLFQYREDAQAFFNNNRGHPRVEALDPDGDGAVCQGLPPRPGGGGGGGGVGGGGGGGIPPSR